MGSRENEALDRAVKILGPLEGRIMRAIWSGIVPEPCVVRDLQRQAPELAYTTLMTTHKRLAEKGILVQDRVLGQRAYLYWAAGTPSEFLASASRHEVAKMVERFGDAALAAFAARLGEQPDKSDSAVGEGRVFVTEEARSEK